MMKTEYINVYEALKLWIGDKFTDKDIEFYKFMKKNNCPEIFFEYNKNTGGGLMGNSQEVDLKNDLVKKDFLNNILSMYKNKRIKRQVKGISIVKGKKQNDFGICDKDLADFILPSIEGNKEIYIYV